MLKNKKTLFSCEKEIRNFNNTINELYIDQLIREDLSLEEKKKLAAEFKQMAARNSEQEEENCEFWYKYGKNDGELKGMLEALGYFAVGYIIGLAIFRK